MIETRAQEVEKLVETRVQEVEKKLKVRVQSGQFTYKCIWGGWLISN